MAVRRRRRELERDSRLLAEAVPIMKAALDELTELRTELKQVTSERDFARLSIKVILGENEKMQQAMMALQNMLYDQQEYLGELERELEDVEAIASEYEHQEVYGDGMMP
jgi:chromosome segregation ATPase